MTYKVGASPRRLLSFAVLVFLGLTSVAHAETTEPTQFNARIRRGCCSPRSWF
jgi:hypothetical protein